MKSSNFQDYNESTGLLFWQTSMIWQRKIKEALQLYNLTHTQFVILAVIEELTEQKICVTQKKISDFSMIDVMTISSTVRLLEKKELICRLPSKTDTRANSLSNTKVGKEILSKAVKTVDKIDSEFFFENKQKKTDFQKDLLRLIRKNKEI
ncbi:MarR family winged helix-turn-helix transcriptional regulator [Clostridioides difficile]|uniref:MarR family winged helix-turn-helix transcriptional regulator n=1 Tax=Clostridioides difficile TaxID=1496 RepID=UPI0031B586C0